ncbi:MAG: hypothetical protein HW390_999 [Candidatus Brocadiaceae bacterium]|nr:hypothetical protein [Candidatus Brocadiaceae bacterium]
MGFIPRYWPATRDGVTRKSRRPKRPNLMCRNFNAFVVNPLGLRPLVRISDSFSRSAWECNLGTLCVIRQQCLLGAHLQPESAGVTGRGASYRFIPTQSVGTCWRRDTVPVSPRAGNKKAPDTYFSEQEFQSRCRGEAFAVFGVNALLC